MFGFLNNLVGQPEPEEQPLPPDRERLRDALRRNAENGAVILMSRRDTSFLPDAVEEDTAVVNAIRSVPTHY